MRATSAPTRRDRAGGRAKTVIGPPIPMLALSRTANEQPPAAIEEPIKPIEQHRITRDGIQRVVGR